MMFYTHIAFSILLGLLARNVVSDQLLFFSLLVVFSLIPDIDNFSLLKFSLGHRTLFHSIPFIFLIFILIFPFSMTIALAFIMAYTAHLFLDSLTPKGIMPFYPLKYKIKGFIKTGSLLENIIFVAICAIIAIILL